ncbi:neurogenic locus notch homolog protein 1-like [Mytilus edulis]|uniref:neurogenic locus notch homolog protein 1-like n=1 Tax=Mytilus edulis TaxID=6550 RepID=UPI0039EDEE6F
MELNQTSLFDNRNLKWSTVVYFFIEMIGLSEAVIQSCVFIPNDSQRHNNACLKYWTTRDMTHGCIFTPANLVFTGRTKTFQDEYLITVNTTDLITEEAIEIWVQRKDGICLNNCCHVPVKSTRFLLDARCPGDWFCLNGGNCFNHHCSCPQGYYGDYCGKYDPCHGVTCQYGGHCTSGRCTCVSGYTGQHCERHDPCHDVTCQHGGHCTFGRCTCVSGYTGQHCERHCSPDPCNGHGICHYTQIGFTCTCNKGYTGPTCASEKNIILIIKFDLDCSSNPCHGHGDCYNGAGGHLCQCHSGYSGINCQTAATKQPIVGSGPILPFGPQTTTKDHVCDKMGLLMDLATGKSVTMQNANACGGKSSDAVILKHCQSPIFSKWKKGIQVNRHCSQLEHYIPIAEWTGHGFSDSIGILVSCQNGVIEMMYQSCSRNLMVHNVTAPASDLIYTVDWM